MPPWTAWIGDGDEDGCTSVLQVVFCTLHLPFRESRERSKFFEFKVNPPSFGWLSPQLTKEAQQPSCRWWMPMTTQRTMIPSRRGYQLDAKPFWPTAKMTKMSPCRWKTNLQNPKMDAKKFIRKLSTSRDTGFLESGSRAILNRTFSLDPSSPSQFPVHSAKVDPSKWTRLWTHHSWSLEVPTDNFDVFKPQSPNPFTKVPYNGFWTTFSNSDFITTHPPSARIQFHSVY